LIRYYSSGGDTSPPPVETGPLGELVNDSLLNKKLTLIKKVFVAYQIFILKSSVYMDTWWKGNRNGINNIKTLPDGLSASPGTGPCKPPQNTPPFFRF
jgi:hypothetical protein